MRLSKTCLLAGISASMLMLSACGDGGGGIESASTTPPPPTPTPAGTAAGFPVNIFPNPKPETYISVGVGSGLSTADSAQPHIRYNNGGYYEIQMPGAAYDRLVSQIGFIPQDPAINFQFQPASAAQNQAYFFTSNSRLAGYLYSEMAAWAAQTGGGHVAFGSATPAGGVPVSGSASYNGLVDGGSDIIESAGEWGPMAVLVKGTVGLSFNFGAGTLGGAMTLKTAPIGALVDLGTFAFKDTVFSAGSTTYSGAFQTSASGQNFFLGRFTGPHGEETIGAWALPFTYSVDGQSHQAFGAWIAKNH